MPQSTATLADIASSSPETESLRFLTIDSRSAGIPVGGAQTETDWELPNRRVGTDEPIVRVYDQWVGAGIPPLPDLYLPRMRPEVVINPSARPMLTDRAKATLDRLLVLLEQEARRRFMPVIKVEVARFIDPEEDTQELVVSQCIRVSSQPALDYWDKLGAAVEVWIDSLPEELRRVAVEQVSVDVRWNIDDTAI